MVFLTWDEALTKCYCVAGPQNKRISRHWEWRAHSSFARPKNGYQEGRGWGSICLGDGDIPVNEAIRRGRISDALQAVESVLNTYNSPFSYAFLYTFFADAQDKGKYEGPELPRSRVQS